MVEGGERMEGVGTNFFHLTNINRFKILSKDVSCWDSKESERISFLINAKFYRCESLNK